MTPLLLLLATASAWTPSTGTTWPGNQMSFEINQQGSRSLSNLDNVERILLESMEQWSAQTCTNFSWTYQGRSGGQSINNGNNVTVYGFTSSWLTNTHLINPSRINHLLLQNQQHGLADSTPLHFTNTYRSNSRVFIQRN